MDLPGAVAVVTGASSGIGESTALLLARAGARVVLAARRLERLEALAERIAAHGGEALPVRCDVAEPADLAELVERTDGAYGRCDVLINNAGIPGGGPFRSLPPAQIERVVRVNLLGVMLGTRAFLPMMLQRRSGHVVNVASLAGRYATPGSSVYGATKHAVVAFGESLYYEIKPFGILVTTVNPGFTKTEGFPQDDIPRPLVMRREHVAQVIVDVIRRGRAPEVSIPRPLAAAQAFRVLTPPLYRWGVDRVTRRGRAGRDADPGETSSG
ncbi:MAG TPA: SDR family NAD(P)-dependent oxidoreductase [Actinomycetota bacterium]|nr:SDR family NAD(P)-dependent oxidoreductase [Actinomycetota bacterium]